MKLYKVAESIARSVSSLKSLIYALRTGDSFIIKKANIYIDHISDLPPEISVKIKKPYILDHAGVTKSVPITFVISEKKNFDAKYSSNGQIKLIFPVSSILGSSIDNRSRLKTILTHELTHAYDHIFRSTPPDYHIETPEGLKIDEALYLTNEDELNAFKSEIVLAFHDYLGHSDEPSIRVLVNEFLKNNWRVKQLDKYLPNDHRFWKKLFKSLYAYASEHPGDTARRHFDPAVESFNTYPKSGHLQSDIYNFIGSNQHAQAYTSGGNRADKIKRLMKAIMQSTKTASSKLPSTPIDKETIETYVDENFMKPLAAFRDVLNEAI